MNLRRSGPFDLCQTVWRLETSLNPHVNFVSYVGFVNPNRHHSRIEDKRLRVFFNLGTADRGRQEGSTPFRSTDSEM